MPTELSDKIEDTTTKEMFRKQLKDSFNQPFPDKRRIIDHINEQKVLLECMDLLEDQIDFKYKDCNGNNFIHFLARKNFEKAIRKCQKILQEECFINLLLGKGSL